MLTKIGLICFANGVLMSECSMTLLADAVENHAVEQIGRMHAGRWT